MAPIKWCWKRRWWSSEAKVEDALSAFEHRPQLPELAGKLWPIKLSPSDTPPTRSELDALATRSTARTPAIRCRLLFLCDAEASAARTAETPSELPYRADEVSVNLCEFACKVSAFRRLPHRYAAATRMTTANTTRRMNRKLRPFWSVVLLVLILNISLSDCKAMTLPPNISRLA